MEGHHANELDEHTLPASRLANPSASGNSAMFDISAAASREKSLAKKKAGSAQEMKKIKAIQEATEYLLNSNQKKGFMDSARADALFGMVIILNTFFIGIEVDLQSKQLVEDEPLNTLWCINSFFLLCFSIEISLRLWAEGPGHFFSHFWGSFDTAITVLGIVDTWIMTPIGWTQKASDGEGGSMMATFSVLRVFRILRLLRVVRLLKVFSELILLLKSINEALKAMIWACLLLAGLIYTSGVFVTMVLLSDTLHQKDAAEAAMELSGEFCGSEESSLSANILLYLNFGSLSQSFWTHIVLVIQEGWTDVADTLIATNGTQWGMYLIVFISMSNFGLMNMVIAMITEKVLGVSENDGKEFEVFEEQLHAFKVCMRAIFERLDCDDSHCLSQNELRPIFEEDQYRSILDAFNVNSNMPFEYLWQTIDLDGSGHVTLEEFVAACVRLRNAHDKSSFQIVMLQCDLMKFAHSVSASQENFDYHARAQIQNLENKVLQKVEKFRWKKQGCRGRYPSIRRDSIGKLKLDEDEFIHRGDLFWSGNSSEEQVHELNPPNKSLPFRENLMAGMGLQDACCLSCGGIGCGMCKSCFACGGRGCAVCGKGRAADASVGRSAVSDSEHFVGDRPSTHSYSTGTFCGTELSVANEACVCGPSWSFSETSPSVSFSSSDHGVVATIPADMLGSTSHQYRSDISEASAHASGALSPEAQQELIWGEPEETILNSPGSPSLALDHRRCQDPVNLEELIWGEPAEPIFGITDSHQGLPK